MSLKIELLSLLSNDLLTIIGDLLGRRLPETENKRICQISGLKSGRGPLRNLRVVAYERALETIFN